MSAVLSAPANSLHLLGGGPSAQVSSFTPIRVSQSELQREQDSFAYRFAETMAGRARSLLASDVYHETRVEDVEAAQDRFSPDEYPTLRMLLTAHAWLQVSKAKIPYEVQLIGHAIDEGLISRISGQRIAITSKGPGPNGTADSKEGQLLTAFMQAGRTVEQYSAVDINRTYAANSSSFMGNKHSVPAVGIQGDFVWGDFAPYPNIPRGDDITEVVTTFGNTPFNAASYAKDGRTVSFEESAENFFGRMNQQHGLGHYLVLTVDTDQNSKAQMKNYAVTPDHEQLILSPFAMARFQGIITEPYPISSLWRMKVHYDHQHNSVIMAAEAKLDHTMKTIRGDFQFSAGQSEQCIMASHKWAMNKHMSILSNAGYEIVDTFKQGHNPIELIVARAARAPRRAPY